MTSKHSFFPAVVFSGLLFWLPFALQIITGNTVQIQRVTKINTVQPAQCGGARGFQIFPIGDFGSGPDTILPFDPGYLTADYAFDTIGPPPAGAYTVANTTAHWGGEAADWLNTDDIDPGNPEGYMLVVNGAPDAGPFIEYTFGVCPNTTYYFHFEALNLYDTLQTPAVLPNIDVLIDGDLFYSASDLPHDGRWNFHDFSFKTDPGISEITITLVNNTDGGEGNVFALDNFFLGVCGPNLLAEELDPQPRCVGDTIQLRVSTFGTPFDTNYVQWQTSLNEGLRWTDFGAPSADTVLTVEGLPDSLWFRALVANTLTGINEPACRIASNEVIITYNDFANCDNYSFTNIGALCTGSLGDNIFPDGDFGAGEANTLAEDPGISPFYQYQPSPPPDDGFYTITNNTAMWPSFGEGWLDTRDNSPDPNGYFMVVNADFNPGIFYVDTVEVCENTLYEFSADVFNLHENQPTFINPNLEFQIDGVSILRSGEVPQDSMWHTYGFTFTTKPGVTELVLSLRNSAPGGSDFFGNDFALDNIRFRPCGPEVTAFEIDPQPRCPGDPVEIRAGITTGYANPSILWQISRDTGATWQDFSGPTTDTILLIDQLPPDAQFRALVAETPEKIDLSSCRIVSDPIVLNYPPVEDCWTTPIDVVGDLCMGNLGANGVPNGNFGRDTSLFADPLEPDQTSYFFLRDSFERDGGYTITNDFHYDPCMGFFPDTCWVPVADPSGDSLGYFMVVNADFEPGIFFREEVTGLCEDITYQFSADILNLNNTFFYPFDSTSTDSITLPNIDFVIGEPGVSQGAQTYAPAVYNTGNILNDSMWQTFGFTFTVQPGVSDLSLAVRNNVPGGNGNDLVLDNITISVCGPEATIAPYQICNDEPLTLQAEITGDQFPNRFIQWEQSTDGGMTWTALPGETGEELFIANPVAGHQYRYLVANELDHLSAELCHVSSEIDTIFIQPEAVTNLEETICEGESVPVGGMTYSETGFYQQTLTAATGCDSIVQLNLTVLDTVLNVLNIGLCAGEDFQGIIPAQDTVLLFQDTTTAGCDSTLQVNIRVSQLRPFQITGDTILCAGETGTLSVPMSGAYLWSTGETTQSIAVDSSGNYSVTVSDDLGCEESATVTVQVSDLQPFDLEVSDTLCIGESTTLTAPVDGGYQWSTGETTASITVDAGGDYSLTIMDDLGCTQSATATILATTLPDPIPIDGNTTLCADASTTLTAEAAGAYLWSTGETTQSITVDAEGDYGVTVTDAFGCQATGTAAVSQNQLTATIDVAPPTCAGDSDGRLTVSDVTGGSGQILYQLDDGAPRESPVFDNLPAGVYMVQVSDEAGCVYMQEAEIPEGDPLSVAILQPDRPIRPGDSLRVQPQVTGEPVSILWDPTDGLSCSDCLNPIASPRRTRTYTLTLTGATGCIRSAELTIEVDDTRRVYIPNAFASGSPAAANQFFTVFGGGDILQIDQLIIFDRWGNQVFQVQNAAPGDPAGAWDGTVNGQPAQTGVYVYYAAVTFSDGVRVDYSGDVTLLR